MSRLERIVKLLFFALLVSALLSDCEARKKKKKRTRSGSADPEPEPEPEPEPPPVNQPPGCLHQRQPCTPGQCCIGFTCGSSNNCAPPPPQ